MYNTKLFVRFEEQATPMHEAVSSLGRHAFSLGNGARRQLCERVFQDLDHVSIDAHAGGLHSCSQRSFANFLVRLISVIAGGFSPTSTVRSRFASRTMSRAARVAFRKWCAKAAQWARVPRPRPHVHPCRFLTFSSQFAPEFSHWRPPSSHDLRPCTMSGTTCVLLRTRCVKAL